jgi:methanol metabolism-related c-type cytochrome
MLAFGMNAVRLSFVAGLLLCPSVAAAQEGPGAPDAVSQEENGKNYDADGNPTFKLEGPSVDWYTYSGYRRYHAECHVCHGPDGEGSSYAPKLVDSVKRMDYSAFLEVVTNGRQNVGQGQENVMPAFGTNLNVMCYIDDLYIYLRARAQGDLPRGRPAKHADKPPAVAEEEKACFGG